MEENIVQPEVAMVEIVRYVKLAIQNENLL